MEISPSGAKAKSDSRANALGGVTCSSVSDSVPDSVPDSVSDSVADSVSDQLVES